MNNDTVLAEAPMPGETISAVTFQIGPQYYALPLDAVHEIVRLPALLTVAGAPPHLAGLLNLRGQHLPVLDGHALLGEPPNHSLASQIMLLDAAVAKSERAARFGLLVDRVCAVALLRREQLSPVGNQSAAFLQAVVAADPDLTLVNSTVLQKLAGL